MRIAVLVPAPGYPEPWRWAYDLEAEALTRAGASVEPVAWTETNELKGFDLILPLVAWGYHLDYGGETRACAHPPDGAIELAKAALALAPAPATYARVDIIPDDEGTLRIMELELIEPALFLDHAADEGMAFTRSILSHLKTATV